MTTLSTLNSVISHLTSLPHETSGTCVLAQRIVLAVRQSPDTKFIPRHSKQCFTSWCRGSPCDRSVHEQQLKQLQPPDILGSLYNTIGHKAMSCDVCYTFLRLGVIVCRCCRFVEIVADHVTSPGHQCSVKLVKQPQMQ